MSQLDFVENENDEVWEEVPEDSDEEQVEPSRRATSRSYSPRTSTIKRRTTQRVFQRTPRTAYRHERRPIQTDRWLDETLQLGKLAFIYLTDVIGGGVHLLRRPLSFLFFLWLLAFILGHISHQLKNALRPLCIIPGISSSAFCDPSPPRAKWADYPKLSNMQTTTFEELLDASVGGSALSIEVKKVEMASKDLLTLVRFSKLTSRELIAESLDKFIEDARSTGRGLQRLSSKIGGSVDSIMAVNNYALHTIENAQANSVSRSIRFLVPFMQPNTKEIVQKTFLEAMTVLSNTIERLIVEAEIQYANLEKLEEDLAVIHELIQREDTSISSQKVEVLGELWTKLGGNRVRLEGLDKHLFLLKNLGAYRTRALAHVVAALQTLRAISDDMEDMRERVTAPELVGASVPVEVHMESIRNGLERLKESRVRSIAKQEEDARRTLEAD